MVSPPTAMRQYCGKHYIDMCQKLMHYGASSISRFRCGKSVRPIWPFKILWWHRTLGSCAIINKTFHIILFITFRMPKWFKTKEKGETVKLYITDPNAESWGGSTKVDIGLTIVTKLEGEEGEQTPHHYAVEVTQYGIADQFGIRWAPKPPPWLSILTKF